jgi:hypothetical protein
MTTPKFKTVSSNEYDERLAGFIEPHKLIEKLVCVGSVRIIQYLHPLSRLALAQVIYDNNASTVSFQLLDQSVDAATTKDSDSVNLPLSALKKIIAPLGDSINLSADRISDLLVGAFEGGSNHWIKDIHFTSPATSYYPFDMAGSILVTDDEGGTHRVNKHSIKHGLLIMLAAYPWHFENIINENDDAETADVFLQCVCLGEIVYG